MCTVPMQNIATRPAEAEQWECEVGMVQCSTGLAGPVLWIRIRIILGTWIRIRIRKTTRIRIRIK